MSGLEQLRSRYPWPAERPDVVDDWMGWFRATNERALTAAMPPKTRVIVELGSLLGLSSRFLAEVVPEVTVICIDHWKGSAEHQGREGWDDRLRELYPRFLRNLWPWRNRVVPMRSTTLDGMRELYELGIEPDLIYIDASHDELNVFLDVSTALELFPKAELVGDDWLRSGVRIGVAQASACCKFLNVPETNMWHLPVEGRRQ